MNQYEEMITLTDGRELRLVAHDFTSPFSSKPEISVFGRVENGSPLYLPRSSGKSVREYGGVAAYKKHSDRGLFLHISVGTYLMFVQRAAQGFGYLYSE